jgi:hypothetical protein
VQYPFAAVLGCADSRAAPELAFDQGPREVFVVRLADNFVNNDGLASLAYGVRGRLPQRKEISDAGALNIAELEASRAGRGNSSDTTSEPPGGSSWDLKTKF